MWQSIEARQAPITEQTRPEVVASFKYHDGREIVSAHAYVTGTALEKDPRPPLWGKPEVEKAVKAWNRAPLLTPTRKQVSWWKTSCADIKAREKAAAKAVRAKSGARQRGS